MHPENTGPVPSAKWKKIPGGLIRISHGSAGVWGVTKGGHIYTMNSKKQWVKIAGGLNHISSGGSQVWGTNNAQHIYQYLGGNRWKRIAGGLRLVRETEDITFYF